MQAGLRNVFALRGGFEAWRAAGMPVVTKEETERPAMQP
jgi:rhodanese-related sulfurtransferase